MRRTFEEVIGSCPACQPERMPPLPREPYRATEKPPLPGRGWSIDLAGPFPRDAEGNCYLAVAVDCLSKWVEACPIPSKHAFRCAEWLYKDVLARWGKPDWIRTDNGMEWEAEFKVLLKEWGIQHIHTMVGNSKGNGQAERMIRTLKDVMRKELSVEPGSYWSDHLPGALIALRHSAAASHGYPPFTIVTGLLPVLPSDITSQPPPTLGPDDITPE